MPTLSLLSDTNSRLLSPQRLTPERQQALAEAPRSQRVARLASASTLGEPETLQALSTATGLPLATNLETDPQARGLLPARLVHDFQVIPIKKAAVGGGEAPSADTVDERASFPLHLAAAWPPD